MQASFDGALPDIPLPHFGSGLSRIHVVTFSLFNSFNAASHDLSNSQCIFWVYVKKVETIKGLQGNELEIWIRLPPVLLQGVHRIREFDVQFRAVLILFLTIQLFNLFNPFSRSRNPVPYA
jgi:hypothetical protein